MAEVINRISMQDSKGFFHWGILRGEIEVWKKIKLIMKPAILQNRKSPKQHPATRNKPTKKSSDLTAAQAGRAVSAAFLAFTRGFLTFTANSVSVALWTHLLHTE